MVGNSLTSSLEHEVKSVLQNAQVYDIYSYGWLNENDADPDMIGHAMWQTDQPYIDHNAVFGESPVHRRPAEIEKHVLTIGEDFCGLMQASRLSIGLALVWAPSAQLNALNESQFFWLHHTDAFLKLAIASNRLRDLLVVACTGSAPATYKDVGKRNRKYVTPFVEAESLLSDRGLEKKRLKHALEDLPKQAVAIFANIDRRNSIVHEVATRLAKNVEETITNLQDQYDDEQISGFTPRSDDHKDWVPGAQARINELDKEFDLATSEIIDWYSLLIDASNNVFQVERWSRALSIE